MAGDRSRRLVRPQMFDSFPADLGVVIGATVLVNVAIFAPGLRETFLRVPLGFAFILFVPGYVIVAALFPQRGESPRRESPRRGTFERERDATAFWAVPWRSRIDGVERAALSFGLSVAIVPVIAILLNLSPWRVRLVPIAVVLSAVTLLAVSVAAIRRVNVPADDRFRVPFREWAAAGRSELLEPDTRADAALNVILALSLLVAVASVGYAITVPPAGEEFSAIYLLTDDGDELIADEYPTEFEPNESREIVLGIDNHEERRVNYTVVLAEQDVAVDDGETTVTEQRELERFETQVAHNETWLHEHELEPTMTGDNVRLVWLLYLDDVPDEPSTENAAYYVHLWIEREEG